MFVGLEPHRSIRIYLFETSAQPLQQYAQRVIMEMRLGLKSSLQPQMVRECISNRVWDITLTPM